MHAQGISKRKDVKYQTIPLSFMIDFRKAVESFCGNKKNDCTSCRLDYISYSRSGGRSERPEDKPFCKIIPCNTDRGGKKWRRSIAAG